MDKNKGWVKLWREQFSHEISDRKPWCDGYAWSYLYARANYKAGIVNFRNQYIPVERGQFVTSKLKLQETFGWSRQRTMSYLISLSSRQMLTYRTTNRFMVITICNYEIYQSKEDENGQTDVPTDQQTDDQQKTTNKKGKKGEKKDPSEISAEISVLVEKIFPSAENKELFSQVRQAISSTRKAGKVSDSILLDQLKAWEKYPPAQVHGGIQTYLSKNYHTQGKGEKYLLGIIRSCRADGNGSGRPFTSTGSPLLDGYYREHPEGEGG